MANEELKPCLRCKGEKATVFIEEDPIANGPPKFGFTMWTKARVICDCGVTGTTWICEKKKEAISEAIAAWNTRPDPWTRIVKGRPETLPKKGEDIKCVICLRGTRTQAVWNEHYKSWDDADGDDNLCGPYDPDYWMPIPALPEGEVGAKKPKDCTECQFCEVDWDTTYCDCKESPHYRNTRETDTEPCGSGVKDDRP